MKNTQLATPQHYMYQGFARFARWLTNGQNLVDRGKNSLNAVTGFLFLFGIGNT